MTHDPITRAAEILRAASYAVAFTGAGISTPSGIPDFRSAGNGLWMRDDPMRVASLSAFRRTPERFFNWLRPLAQTSLEAAPNPAHRALVDLEQAGRLQGVITQNIDGLHQRAGSRTVHELHGSLNTLTCPGCRRQYPLEQFRQPFFKLHALPRCPLCDQILKPDIVLFEEELPPQTWSLASAAAARADAMLVAGSSLEVVPAAYLPGDAAFRGARMIIVNYTPTGLDAQAEVVLRGDVAKVLPEIAAAVLKL